MTLLGPGVGALLWKELRQIRRGRAALLSTTLLPLLLLVVVPLGQFFGLRSAVDSSRAGLAAGNVPPLPGIADITDPVQMFTAVLFPLFVALGGLVVPSVAATYTVVAEREKRSLELLMALPVRVGDILAAKVLAMLLLAGGVMLPLFALDVAILITLGAITPGYAALLLLVLLSALACSIGIALLLALLARDFRTANNLNGALAGPSILLTTAILFGVPGDGRLLLLSAALLLGAALSILAALRWLTFERYLA